MDAFINAILESSATGGSGILISVCLALVGVVLHLLRDDIVSLRKDAALLHQKAERNRLQIETIRTILRVKRIIDFE
jgi:hypothetical protein